MPSEQEAARESAENEFTQAEAKGNWSEWVPTGTNTTPPWWEAGTEYVWKIVQVRTRTALAFGQAPYSIRALWHISVRAESLIIWNRLRPYEAGLEEIPGELVDLSRPTPRQTAFVKYVSRKLYPRLASLLLTAAATAQDLPSNRPLEGSLSVPTGTSDPKGPNRRAAIDAFISKMGAAGHKITRKDISTVVGYKDRTEFERFQREDKRTTRRAVSNFNHALSLTPEEFMRALLKKTSK
ncbi:MAG TPA: hypothetical protein VK335_15635 [Bryobacteraceae bacterium]|nr:hypothetical protein [Bryobacteraceae bacterium]